jgi:hypothetical protein
MFERFGDLPLHVLVVHLAVVVLPVAALTGIVFALVPRWRWFLRWPALLLGVGTLVCAYVAKKSGEAFETAVPTLTKVVAVHAGRANLLFWYCVIFAVISIAAYFLLGGRTALASGKGSRETISRPLEIVTQAAVVVIAVLVLYQTIRTGDAGARAVWEGQLPAK